MKKIFKRRSVFTVLFLLGLIFTTRPITAQTAAPEGISVTAATLYGVTATNQLIRFNSASPGSVTTVGQITGLQSGEDVLGIDFRPATGDLYALGSTSRLYVINKTTAAATAVGVLSTALNGTSFGFDFNPTVDRIRVVSNTGQNLRLNPNNAAVTVDTNLGAGATGADAAAYTNSFSGSTATTLYDISSVTDMLYLQGGAGGTPSPNGGALTAVGPLGVNVTDVNGFDTLSSDGTAFAAMTSTVLTSLYAINLSNGAASAIGLIGTGTTSLRGLAVDIGSTTNSIVYGVTTANNLVRFNSARPSVLLSNVPISGLQSGESVLGIDFRPANGQLYALGSTNRLYTINLATGAATQVGTAGAFTLTGTDCGFDFNPVPDRIRVVSNTGQNLRLNPNDGTLAGTDTPLNPGTPSVTAAAYTNSFNGATSTTLYVIDTNADTLNLQGGLNGMPSPNGGVLTPVGALGVDASGANGFDIRTGNNTALAALQSSGATGSALYSVNLTTGAASVIGPIGGGAVIRGIAIGASTASSASTATLDFDGDRRTDYSIFRISENNWYINRSSNNSLLFANFGLAESDTLMPGDYDGDGRTDIAVWRTSNGVFYVLRSSDGTVQIAPFGQPGDEPVARDYDGDGKTDLAIARRAGGVITWYIQNSSNAGVRIEQFGFDSDVVAPGDYDGDGRFDLAVHRGVGGQPATFFIQRSTTGFAAVQWGLGGDLIVPGDYDGDGKTDYAVVRAGTPYVWYILRSTDNFLQAAQFGTKPQLTTQGDYDGDGKTDLSTFDPINGIFYVFRSSNGAPSVAIFGQNGDNPVANYDTH